MAIRRVITTGRRGAPKYQPRAIFLYYYYFCYQSNFWMLTRAAVIFIYVLCSNRLIATSATPRSAGTLRQWRSRLALFAFRTRAYRAFLSLNVLALVLRLYRVVALPRVNDFDESARRASIPSPFLTLRTHSRVLCCFMYINYFIVVRL